MVAAVLKQPQLPASDIAALLRAGWGLIADVRFRAAGFDANAWAYDAFATDGSRWFAKLRRAPTNPAAAAVPWFLHQQGLSAVVAPRLTISGGRWQPAGPYDLLLYPFVPGTSRWMAGLSDAQWLAHGRFVRALHDSSPPPTVAAITPFDRFEIRVESVRARLPAIETRSTDAVIDEAARLLRDRAEVLERLLAATERLAGYIARSPGQPVLCHTDLHPGNLLGHDTGPLSVVDWDAPAQAPRERDLMFVFGAYFGEQRVNPAQEALFRRGYGPVDIDPGRLAFYHHARVVEDVDEFLGQILDTAIDDASRRDDLWWLGRQFRPGATIDQALAWDRRAGRPE
jgi:spectinomycin phosphotransferase